MVVSDGVSGSLRRFFTNVLKTSPEIDLCYSRAARQSALEIRNNYSALRDSTGSFYAMKQKEDYILSAQALDASALEMEISSALAQRLQGNGHFNSSEISEISEYPFRLFPKGFVLTANETTKMRAMATLSQCQLKPAAAITSHRRFIGPCIVFIKKLSWPFIKLHLKDTLAGIQGFQSWTVKTVAELIVSSRTNR